MNMCVMTKKEVLTYAAETPRLSSRDFLVEIATETSSEKNDMQDSVPRAVFHDARFRAGFGAALPGRLEPGLSGAVLTVLRPGLVLGLPGRVLLRAKAGSQAFGTALPSDKPDLE